MSDARPTRRDLVRLLIAPAVGLVLLLASWSLLVRVSGVRPYILPGPGRVAASSVKHAPEIVRASVLTAAWAACGLMLSLAVGVAVAAIFSLFNTLRAALHPFVTLAQTIPVVSVAGVLVHLFGYGHGAVIATSFFMALFPVVTAATAGMTTLDRGLSDLFRLHRASRWQTWVGLQLPASVPYLVAGLKIASSLAVIGAVVGEYIMGIVGESGQSGLGLLIFKAFVWDTDYMFALTVATVILGSLFFGAVELVELLALGHWRRG